jgi:cytochrome c2
MWNHAAGMSASVQKQGFVWPKLSNQDVTDLMIYFRSLPTLRSRSNAFGMGEPEQGRLVFERSCESCHSFGPGIGKKIDLFQRRAPQTVTSYIAAMWNHADLMRARNGAQFKELDPEDMPDLVAFLFSQFYFFDRGDAVRGRRVFDDKNCARCHEQRRTQTGAPDLAHSAELYSPITLTSALWDHAPAMFEAMKQDRLAWPRFRGSEMADLIAYLNSRVIVRIAPTVK